MKAALSGTDTYVYVLDKNFYSIVSTRTEYGAAPVLSADIPTSQRALESKDVAVSGLVVGKVSGNKVVNVLYPVFDCKISPMIMALSRNASSLEQALLSDKLPNGWNVAILDRAGIVIAASKGAGTAGDAFTLADVGQLSTTEGFVTLRSGGESYRAVVRQSPFTNWTLIAWAPNSVISQPLMDAVWSLAVGGLLLAAIVVLVVYWVTLQIGRSVRGLEGDAKRLGTGQPVTARQYPISEIASVSEALEEAS